MMDNMTADESTSESASEREQRGRRMRRAGLMGVVVGGLVLVSVVTVGWEHLKIRQPAPRMQTLMIELSVDEGDMSMALSYEETIVDPRRTQVCVSFEDMRIGGQGTTLVAAPGSDASSGLEIHAGRESFVSESVSESPDADKAGNARSVDRVVRVKLRRRVHRENTGNKAVHGGAWSNEGPLP